MPISLLKVFSVFLFIVLGLLISIASKLPVREKPLNILILHTDQWRAQAFGYRNDPNVKTPNIDQMATASTNLYHAVSGILVFTPLRASLIGWHRPTSLD